MLKIVTDSEAEVLGARRGPGRVVEMDLLYTRARMREALVQIRQQGGKVCDAYDICAHRSCASSYASWALADEALRLLERGHTHLSSGESKDTLPAV